MRAIVIAAALIIIACPVTAENLPPISPAQALQHIGACMTVEGRASIVPASGRFGVSIGLDATGENALFVAYVPSVNAFPDLNSLDGQTVDITGVVHIDRGKAAIMLTNPELISRAGTDPGKLLTCDND